MKVAGAVRLRYPARRSQRRSAAVSFPSPSSGSTVSGGSRKAARAPAVRGRRAAEKKQARARGRRNQTKACEDEFSHRDSSKSQSADNDIHTRPTACRRMVPATAHWPIGGGEELVHLLGIGPPHDQAMKYVSSITATVETSDWAELERMRRAISMRSRIVRPTLAKVGARLPPVSHWTAKAEREQEEGLQRDALASVRDRPRADRLRSGFGPPPLPVGTQGAARFAHGVFQGVGDAGPGPQGGHHQVDGVGQLGFDFCGMPRAARYDSSCPPSRPTISPTAITKGEAQPRTKCIAAASSPTTQGSERRRTKIGRAAGGSRCGAGSSAAIFSRSLAAARHGPFARRSPR